MARLIASGHATRGLARLDAFEYRICIACNRLSRHRPVRLVFQAVSRLGDGMFWYALIGALALAGGSAGRTAALQMMLSALTGVVLYRALKKGLVRERPFITHDGIECAGRPLDRYSFPSGHTLQAVLLATLAIAWFPALAALLVSFTLLVALSRPVLGLHYPSDVLAGGLIGWSLAHLSLALLPPA